MFTKEQQQLYNQAYNASGKLEAFVRNYASAAGNAGIERRGKLQLQGLLTEIGLAPGKPMTDEAQMFIRSLVTDAAQLREEIPGYGRYFLDITPEHYAALQDVMGDEVNKPLIALQAAVRQTNAGDRRCLDAVLTQLLLICSSFVMLEADPSGAKAAYVGKYLEKTRRYLYREGMRPSAQVTELMEQMQAGRYGISSVTASRLAEQEDMHILSFGSDWDSNGSRPGRATGSHQESGSGGDAEGSRLDALSAMIDENLNTIRDLAKMDAAGSRMQKSLSSLVDDFFGGTDPSFAASGTTPDTAAGAVPDIPSEAAPGTGKDESEAAPGTGKDESETGTGASGSEEPQPEPQLDLSAEDAQQKIDEILEELNNLIGLTTVKEEVSSLINVQKVNLMRKEAGLKEADVSKHLVFSGNPGTGKTTVARILAKVYHALGLLKQGQLIEVDRAGLVAGYIGQTAIKTKEVIDSAMGGILFIDEAYTLSAGKGEGDFGQEAIDTILKAMEDHRDEFIVIVAGYTDLMEEFLDSNPGLRSRFNKFIHFPDYTPEELRRIFEFTAGRNGYKVSQDALEYLQNSYTLRLALAEPNFANARDARNIFEKAVTRQANRLADKPDCTREELELLTLADITGDLPETPVEEPLAIEETSSMEETP